MRISYGKESGAFTIYLREGKPDHAEDLSKEADGYVDAEGRVLSIEALSFEDLRNGPGGMRREPGDPRADR